MSAPVPVGFHGCDYLGLSRDPRVLAAATEALASGQLGVGASPATTGRRPVHERLERAAAGFVGAGSAALLPTGALANVAALQALAASFERAWIDPRAHVSLRAARAAAGIAAAPALEGGGLALVDGVYPARGEAPDLRALAAELGPDGVLLVDDAHGLGVLGPDGRGAVAAAAGTPGALGCGLVQVLTFSKALGAGGAAVCGSARLVAAVRASDGYAGSTALAPVLAAGAEAALGLVASEPARREGLWRHVAAVRAGLERAGRPPAALAFPVFALRGTPARPAAALREALLEAGFDVPLVRYPDGVADEGYLRLAVSAAHSDEDVARLADTLAVLRP